MKLINKKNLKKNYLFNILKKISNTNENKINKYFEGTRDNKNIDIYECTESGCLFLSKIQTNINYYMNKRGYFKNFEDYKKKTYLDDKRRYDSIKLISKNKSLLDVGAGTGQFAELIKDNVKKIDLVEPDKYLFNKLKSNFNIYQNLNEVENKYEIITLYHVLEHIQDPIKFLKLIKTNLKKKGKVIIEVPQANDALIKKYNLISFKKHTFWSEHLFLYTDILFEKLLKYCGFKKFKIIFTQRYDLNNHLQWILKDKNQFFDYPINFNNIKNYESLNKLYINFLKKNKITDSITVIAENE